MCDVYTIEQNYLELKVEVDVKKIIIVTEDHGGYLAGRCTACDTYGWLTNAPYGYPNRVKGKGIVMENRIIHKKKCPMNEVLDDKGNLLKKK